jgi:hypothetical protein
MPWHGPGYIAMIDETMDSQLYIQILHVQKDLQVSVEYWGLAKEELVFQHDNDLKHTAKVQYAKKDFTCFAKFDIFHSIFMFLYPIGPEGHMTVPWYCG